MVFGSGYCAGADAAGSLSNRQKILEQAEKKAK